MTFNLFRAAYHSLRLALIAALIAGYGTATAGNTQITCSDGSVIFAPAVCPVKDPAVTQPGVINNTVSGAVVDLGNTIGGALSGAFGGGSGGTQTSGTARGITRAALSFGETGAAAAAGRPRWNAWAALTQVAVGYSFQPLQSGGKVNVALGGIDYTIGDNLIVGVAVSDERTRVDLNFNGGKISANGNTIAPYLGWRITPNWQMDATIGFGSTSLSSVDNSVAGGITGNNKDKRTLASAGLAYNHVMGQWLLTAKGGLSTSEDKFSSFTLSNNTFVPGLTSRTTQVRIGGQAAYNMGNLVPFFGVAYINDIQRPNQAPVGGQNAANDRDGWQLRAGINIRSSGALYGGVQVSSEVGRSQVKNDQILFNLGIRF
jgi:Autotransporter beta-domain